MANLRWRLLRKKEAIIVILWYAVISLWLQGSGFAPIFQVRSNTKAGQWTYAISIIVLYPVIGLLGDMWIGRYKIINFSLWIKWITVIIVTMVSTLYVKHIMPRTMLQADIIIVILSALEQVGFTAFQVIAIQFGTDQLQGAPSEHLSSFIVWFTWVEQLATPITEWFNFSILKEPSISTRIWMLLGWSIMEVLLLSAIISIKSCFMSTWFVREPGTPNPYHLVYHVVKFAWKHKHPVQRNALTHWEDKKPSRIDFGKCKYGGPFTAEEVENVKKLLQLTAVLLSLFGIFLVGFGIQFDWQSLVMVHIGGRSYTNQVQPAQLYEAVCDTVVLGALIPLHEFVIYPLFQKYIPSMLKRIWIGAALVVACCCSILLIDAIGHRVYSDVDCFRSDSFTSLNLSPYVVIPSVFYGLSTIIFNIALVEFIVIRSPHSMKGMLLGLYYTFRFGITECFPLSLQYAFNYDNSNHSLSCGTSYYLMLTIIGLLSMMTFTIVAYKLKNWKNEEAIDVHPFVEEDYEE